MSSSYNADIAVNKAGSDVESCGNVKPTAYGLRLNLNVAIVPMTTNRPVTLPNGTIVQVADLTLDPKEKGYILSAFYCGYILSEFPGGWLSSQYGGASIFCIGIFFTAIWSILLPFTVCYGSTAIIAIRILAGLCEGGIIPSTNAIWSRWAPPEERTILFSISFVGSYATSLVGSVLYGNMAHYLGWPTLFYIPGALTILWCLLWHMTIKNDPADDPKITESELKYLQASVLKKPKNMAYPWKKIFTSSAVWAVIIATFAEGWGYFTVFTIMPTFFNDYYKYNVQDSGVLLSVANITPVIGIPIVGIAADHFRKKYSTTLVRKLFNTIASVGQICCLLLIVCTESVYVTTIIFALWMWFDGFIVGGYIVNNLDIAPSYAGVLTGISNTFGNLAGILSPTVAGYVVFYQGIVGWKTVFIICSVLYTIAFLFYLKFASGEVQPWASKSYLEEKNTDAK